MSDTKKEIICPACKTKMEKVITKHGIIVDICTNGCGGIWFDNRELGKFTNITESISEIEDSVKNKTFNVTETEKIRKCPVCQNNMVKHKACGGSDVEIDDCYSCGGKFLDFGELERIRRACLDMKK